MSQHDMNLANQAGAPFRADLNSALQAIATTHSGTSRPATVFAGQQWIKTDYAANTWGLYLYDGTGDRLLFTVNTSTGATLTPDADKLDGQHGAFYDDMPDTTRTVFYQASAPTGWTQVTSINDRVLRVVSGAGGGTGGSWTISGLTHSHTHNFDLPDHKHQAPIPRLRGTANDPNFPQNETPYGTGDSVSYRQLNTTESTSNTTTNHPLTDNPQGNPSGTTAGASTNNVSSDGNWRPSYADVIVCERAKP